MNPSRFLFTFFFFFISASKAQSLDASEGPFSQLIIRGATLINGTGAPPIGPVDITVENDKITAINVVGYPGVEIQDVKRPKLKKKRKRN